jgi:hypothetical protein
MIKIGPISAVSISISRLLHTESKNNWVVDDLYITLKPNQGAIECFLSRTILSYPLPPKLSKNP